MEFVGGLSFPQKLEESVKRTLPLLGPEARAQLSGLLTPQTIGVMATVLAAWVLSHAVGAYSDLIRSAFRQHSIARSDGIRSAFRAFDR